MYNILVVDDEKIERNGILFLIKKMGFDLNVSQASNGLEALETLKSHHFDILMTDVKMPFMDGIELITNAITFCNDMKMIIFSGYNEFEYAKLAVKLGVSDYILKPVDPQEFENTLNKVIREIDDLHLENEIKIESSEYTKEFLLYSLLNGANPEKIQKKCAHLLGENIWNSYKRMLLLEFNFDVFGKIIIDFQSEVMNNFDFHFQYLNLNQQQSVIFLNAKNNTDIRKMAESIHDMVDEIYHEKCYIAVSEVIVDYSKLSKNLEELDSLMENRFYQVDTYIFMEEVYCESPVIVQIDDDMLMKKIKQDIKMKDIVSMRMDFENLCKKYRSKTNFSHIYIKFIFSNLLKDFYDTIPDINEQFNSEIDKLYKSVDFNCIMEIVGKHIDRLEKAFLINPLSTHKEIEVVKKNIYEHYNEEIGVDQLAQMVYLTPSYLSSIFKKETGQNLNKFIKQYRMEKAKQMLENTMKKIVNISKEVGYPNVSYFCQSFREYFGVSPEKFRSNGGRDEKY